MLIFFNCLVDCIIWHGFCLRLLHCQTTQFVWRLKQTEAVCRHAVSCHYVSLGCSSVGKCTEELMSLCCAWKTEMERRIRSHCHSTFYFLDIWIGSLAGLNPIRIFRFATYFPNESSEMWGYLPSTQNKCSCFVSRLLFLFLEKKFKGYLVFAIRYSCYDPTLIFATQLFEFFAIWKNSRNI